MEKLTNLEETMKEVCAWCGKLISGKKSDPDISHGICEKCEEIERKALDKLLKKKQKKDKK